MLGPAFETLTVNTTSDPAKGLILSTDLVNDKLIKAVGTVVTAELLLAGFGSTWPLAVTCAVFLYSLAVPVIGFTLTTISKYSVDGVCEYIETRKSTTSKSLSINGAYYKSIREAERALGICRKIIERRIKAGIPLETLLDNQWR